MGAAPAVHAEQDSSYGLSDSDFSEEPDCVLHYVPASAPAATAGAVAQPTPPAVMLMDLTQASSHSSQEPVAKLPDAATAVHERMSPEELFSADVDGMPDFASLPVQKQVRLGTHFGLKYSVNLPRILSDIWTRMRQTGAGKASKGSRGASKAKASGAKRGPGAVASDAEEPAKKQKSKASGSKAPSEPEAAAASSVFSAVTDAHDAAIAAVLQSDACADLYEKMLLFLPVDLDELHPRLCGAGVKIGKAKLQKFLDRGSVFVSAGAKVSSATGRKSHASLNGKRFAHINKMRSPANSQTSVIG